MRALSRSWSFTTRESCVVWDVDATMLRDPARTTTTAITPMSPPLPPMPTLATGGSRTSALPPSGPPSPIGIKFKNAPLAVIVSLIANDLNVPIRVDEAVEGCARR